MSRKIWIVILLFAVNMISLSQSDDLFKDSNPASTNVQNAQFPRITSDLRVIYRIKAPDVQKVQFDLGKIRYGQRYGWILANKKYLTISKKIIMICI